jgi:hypothetical protein
MFLVTTKLLRVLQWPEPAQSMYLAGDIEALVQQLGDNYARYHGFLAAQLVSLGRPRPDRFASKDAYFRAWMMVEDVVWSEAALRQCRNHQQFGAALSAPVDARYPLVDSGDRLVSLDDVE